MKNNLLFCLMLAIFGLSVSAQNNWSGMANFGGSARVAAVGFSIDSKGYVGTGSDNISALNDFWEYDPITNVWTQKANVGGDARYSAVGFSIGSKGYIGTGRSSMYAYKDFWEYNPTANTWVQKADFVGLERHAAVGFSIGSKGYIGTGSSLYGGDYQDFFEYNPTTNTWTQKANFGGGYRYYAVGFSICDKGYIGTGLNNNNFYNDFWEYNPSNNTWSQKTNFGGVIRGKAVGFSICTYGYIGLGNHGSYYNDFWEYNPNSNMWIQKADFVSTPRDGAVGFSINGKGYVGTGENNLNNLIDFLVYTPTNINVPQQPGAITGISSPCSGSTNVYSVSSDPCANTYTWTLPSGWIGTSTTNSISTTASTSSGNIIVTANNNCGSSPSQTLLVTVTASPTIPTITQNLFVLMSSYASGNQWYLNGVIIPNATSQFYTVTQNGSYTVQVTISGCSSISTVYPINNVGIDSFKEFGDLNIFPNPSEGCFTLNYSSLLPTQNPQIIIYNALGSIIYRAEQINHLIDLSKLPKGIYFVHLFFENSYIANKKIILK